MRWNVWLANILFFLMISMIPAIAVVVNFIFGYSVVFNVLIVVELLMFIFVLESINDVGFFDDKPFLR